MDIINLLVQLLSGAVGGNVAGNLSRSGGLGAPANTLSGAVGGGIGDDRAERKRCARFVAFMA